VVSKGKQSIYLCAISNVQSGACKEDCKFCTQSLQYGADVSTFGFKSVEDVVNEAKKAKENKASGFCLVTAGKGLDDKKIEKISAYARTVKKELDINLIGCNGIATIEQLKELKNAGIDSYNHNLETAKEFYNEVCTTHSWEERFQTCLNAKEVGLNLCSGGIFGLGETLKNRNSFINSLKELKPKSVAINFFHQNESLPIKQKPLTKQEALDIIKRINQEVNPLKTMVAGGREIIFKDNLDEIFKSGANSIVIGDYLTTKGNETTKEISLIENLGYNIKSSCNE
jgi:biotin synthase